MKSDELWVGGLPATFATKGERSWKDCLQNTISYSFDDECNGLDLKFYLPTLTPNGHPLDVDNLCEPVFSVLINRLGWFHGKRLNLQWWRASKAEANQPGLRIKMGTTSQLDREEEFEELSFDDIYNDSLPHKATDPGFPDWIYKHQFTPAKDVDRFVLRLMFNSQKLNIGDIATGRVKNVIDCLYPIVGGSVGNPDDWRIDSLLVQKGVLSLAYESVRVSLWRKRDNT